MAKCPDLGLNMLFGTNWCALLKSVKKWSAQCENDKTCRSRANNAVLDKLVHSLKSGAASAKMRKRADLGQKTLLWTN